MKRTTIMLPQDLKVQAFQYAHRIGISLAELIRESLKAKLSHSKEQHLDDPLFADDAVFCDQAPEDLAENHDHYLYGGK